MTATLTDATAEAKVMPQDGRSYEFVEGEWVEKRPMSNLSAYVATRIVVELGIYEKKCPNVGNVVSEGLFLLENCGGQKRKPDVAFLLHDRYPTANFGKVTGFIPVPPNLAIEVVSTNDIATDLENKAVEYLQHGVREVWIVYPIPQRIYAYIGLDQIRVFTIDKPLRSDLLPGFEVPMRDLFPKSA